MWTEQKSRYVDNQINAVRDAFLGRSKDEMSEALNTVETDTGYQIDFLYDIFIEIFEEEMEDCMDYGSAAQKAADQTVMISYEQDW